MSVKKDKTTVIFVDQNQGTNRPIQVSSVYIKHWKKYVAGLIGLFFLLIGTIFYLSYNIVAVEQSKEMLTKEMLTKTLTDKNKISAVPDDTSAIKKYLLSIDKKMLTINKYLNARGVKSILKNKGGAQESDTLSTLVIGEFYDNYLNKMINYLAYTPIGYPHLGVITSGYGYRENPFTGENVETHKGLDIKGRYGDLVKSTASGKVIYAGRRGGYGNCIVISHGNGLETFYAHLSKILIAVGTHVNAGDKIGRIGSTGRSTGPHLHYEIHQNNKIINPRSFLTIE